jgi:hypothetical protein
MAMLVTLVHRAASADELWVIAEKTRRIWVIDTITNLSSTSPIGIADPNGDGTLDTPTDIAFSTAPNNNGNKAYVTQGPLLTVLNVPTRTIQRVIDVGDLIGNNRLVLNGIAASSSRSYRVGSTRRNFSYLFLSGTVQVAGIGDRALWIVLDQTRVLSGATTGLLVGTGTLADGFHGGDIAVLDDPVGAQHQRAWFNSIDDSGPAPYRLRADLLATPDVNPPAFAVASSRLVTLSGTSSPPKRLQLGSTWAGASVLVPWYSLGVIRNLEHNTTCMFPSSISAVAMTGPGEGSMSIFALNPTGRQLLMIDPSTCGFTQRATGIEPVAIVPLRTYRWHSVFVINRSSNTVTRFFENGTLPLTITVGTGGDEGPLDGGIGFVSPCAIEDLTVEKSGPDLQLSWSNQGCNVPTFAVFANCADDDPDCIYDCTCPSLDPACFCPAFEGAGPAFAPLLPGAKPGKRKWVQIGSPNGTSFTIDDANTPDMSVDVWVGADEGIAPP